MLKIRKATLLDYFSLYDMAEKYYKEVKFHENFPIDMDVLMQNVFCTLRSEDGAFLVAFLDNKPVGLLWGELRSLPWTNAKVAVDFIFYVKPEARKSGVGTKLLEEWVAFGKERGASAAQISCASGIHPEVTDAFYQKQGFKPIGRHYRIDY